MATQATQVNPSEVFQIFTRISSPSIPENMEAAIKGGLISFAELVQAHSDAIINAYLLAHNGNVCRAARAAGMHRNTFGRRIDSMRRRGVLIAAKREYRKVPYGVRVAVNQYDKKRLG